MTTHRIIQGDTKKGLKSLPEKCIQLTVTSPPYFGLRKYLDDDVPGKEYEIGLEETPEQYIKNLVEVFREVWRVTRDDGVLYLNLGDSYAGSGKGPTGKNGIQSAEKRMGFDKSDSNRGSHKYNLLGGKIPEGLKSKDLMGIPWKVAFALQTDGARSPETIIEIDKIRSALLSDFDCWAEVPKHTREAIEDLDNEWEHAHHGAWYFRSAMPWIKRSCMPESITDRPASAIEYVFLMTKSPRYYYDAEAIRCPSSESYRNDPRPAGMLRQRINKKSKYPDSGQFKKVDWAADKLHNGKTGHFHEKEKMAALGTNVLGHSGNLKGCDGNTRSYRNSDPFFESWQGLYSEADDPLAFIINPQARPELHFASFPNLLAETCIKAGTSEYGCCPKCGMPWQRIIEKNPNPSKWAHDENDRGVPKSMGGNKQSSKSLHRNGNNCQVPRGKTTGWQPGCKCEESERIPCTVLDPFMGRGTVAIVARDLGRSSIGCELNPDYIEIIKQQLQSNSCLDTGTVEYIFTKV